MHAHAGVCSSPTAHLSALPRAADGPFYATGAAQGKAIFALGLRNPFATLVAPAVLDGLPKAGVADGALLVFDVGEDSWEEINAVASPGANGGWPSDEGFAAQLGPQQRQQRSDAAPRGRARQVPRPALRMGARRAG
jgi:hypothetical protein